MDVLKTLKKVRPAYLVYSSRLRTGGPAWASGKPVSLQLDTQTRCSLKCVYCNPQSCFVDKVDKVDMDYSNITRVLEELRRNKVFLSYTFAYMNGDPLFETRLPQISLDIKRALGCPVKVFTNGVEYSNRRLLVDPNLDEIRFTISASGPQLYKIVHGRDRYADAIRTLNFVKDNKYFGQTVGVNFILFDGNVHDLDNWEFEFRKFDREIRVLHSGETRETSSMLTANNPLIDFYRERFFRRLAERERPCSCFGDMSISVEGKLLQCCDTPYRFNYGHVEENDVLEMWNKRLDAGLDAEGCRNCVQKNPKWRELFEKYVWR